MDADPDPSHESLAALRREYQLGGLAESDLPDDPIAMFDRWFAEVRDAGLYETNAMVLTTVSADGRPSSRAVLLKGYDERGWRFFTNRDSRKGQELAHDGRCALVFPWFELQRQVRVEGTARPLQRAEDEAYFATRPRPSQIGAWASAQSSVVAGRDALDSSYAATAQRFADEEHVPCPPHWGGYVVAADVVEFWQGREGRMHDRLVYTRAGDRWQVRRLAP